MQDWIVGLVRSMGAPGVGLLMFAENLFPPLPSEFIMPLAGYLSLKGGIGFAWAVIAGSVGSLLGALLWFWVGRRVRAHGVRCWIERHGAWLGLRVKDVERSERFFVRHGQAAVFFGRLVPVVRTLISVPAGYSAMPFLPFLAFTALGTALWTALLAYGGRLLGRAFPQIGQYLGVIAWLVIGLAVAAYVWRVVTIHREREPAR